MGREREGAVERAEAYLRPVRWTAAVWLWLFLRTVSAAVGTPAAAKMATTSGGPTIWRARGDMGMAWVGRLRVGGRGWEGRRDAWLCSVLSVGTGAGSQCVALCVRVRGGLCGKRERASVA